jgi:SAM-dependent methyltransferase
MTTFKDKHRLKTHTSIINIEAWEKDYNEIDNVLKKLNKNNINLILDIGCGMAHRSILLSKKYNSELYLIDSDCSNNDNTKTRGNKFDTADNFKAYFHLIDIHNKLKKYNVKYKLYDYNKNIDINNNIKFDIICSFLSCGFHYPFETYNFLYSKYSNKNTLFIFDIRNNTHEDLLSKINILYKIKLKKCIRVFFTLKM